MRTLLTILVSTLLLGAQQAPVSAPKPAAEAKPQVQAPVPKPITDAEARKVRELQLSISEAQNALLQLERTFKTKQGELQDSAKALDTYINTLQSKYGCPDYDLDQGLSWKKKPGSQPGAKKP
jgi:biopolymer transport protein ExbD